MLTVFSKSSNNLSKLGKEAGECFLSMVQCHAKLKSTYEVATDYTNAATCFRKAGEAEKTKICFDGALSAYTELGKFSQAAKAEKEFAETLEEEGDLKGAGEHFKNAADFFETENQKAAGQGCMLKVAHINALLERYDDAIRIFEDCAQNSLEDKLLKWGVKEYLFKAALCQLAKLKQREDYLDIKAELQKYEDMDVHYPESYEGTLVKEISACFENEQSDVNSFTAALRKYDKIKKLENWHTTLLLKVKDVLAKEPSLE